MCSILQNGMETWVKLLPFPHFVNIETNEKIIGVSNYESVTRGAQQLIELLEGDNK